LEVQCGEARVFGVHCGKKTVIYFLTMDKDGIKVNFKGTGEIIGGASLEMHGEAPIYI